MKVVNMSISRYVAGLVKIGIRGSGDKRKEVTGELSRLSFSISSTPDIQKNTPGNPE